MNSLKPTISRSTRTNSIAQNLGKCPVTQRQLSSTTKNATLGGLSTKSQSPTPFVTQNIPHIKPFDSVVSPGSQRFNRQETPFHHLMNSITRCLTTTPSPSLPQLFSLLRAYSSSPSHWSKYAHADPTKAYTRNLVCEVPGVLNLLLLVWTPGKASPVHDHADSHCLMKVLQGEIHEARYAMPSRAGEEGPMVQTSSVLYGMNKVSYMADELGLHSIANPHPMEYAVSLHLYTPPNAALRGCYVYDEESSEARHVMQGVYDSVGGEVKRLEK